MGASSRIPAGEASGFESCFREHWASGCVWRVRARKGSMQGICRFLGSQLGGSWAACRVGTVWEEQEV